MAFMQPLPADAHPELASRFATFERNLDFVPNSAAADGAAGATG